MYLRSFRKPWHDITQKVVLRLVGRTARRTEEYTSRFNMCVLPFYSFKSGSHFVSACACQILVSFLRRDLPFRAIFSNAVWWFLLQYLQCHCIFLLHSGRYQGRGKEDIIKAKATNVMLQRFEFLVKLPFAMQSTETHRGK